MKGDFWIRLAASVAIAIALLFLPINAAIAQVPIAGTFRASSTCEAPRARGGANPGNVRVSNGQRYEALSFNSEDRKFIQIKVPGANPERRWVSTSCGTFSEVSPSPTPVPAPTPSSVVKPFFDTVNNPEQHRFPLARKEDITPPPPQLTEFDEAVLKTCSSIGSKVTASDFKQLMSDHPDVLREIQQAVGGQLLPVRSTQAEFLDDLTAVWSKREAFEHIFCGELEGPEKIGGLHFVGRYLQLQKDGIGGRLSSNLQKEEVIPGVVYTLGVVIKKGSSTWSDDIKGYALVSDAKELMKDATKAFKAQGNAQGACILPVRDGDTGKSYNAVFVKDRDAIVTFYPDATPKGNPCRN
ncbi:EndoU domain-containing protein [Argonema galeatum]|uniref:EndoU domain-containing protein n=1 Tax=Argonema galeatum TaxID=2942762 RepID=UPI0020122ED7|nr:EndoU domain-containing protein [Argonema galeatum]MCL1466518.1 EndoU domain-containing protein [Argonema galeatum A003/A1]